MTALHPGRPVTRPFKAMQAGDKHFEPLDDADTIDGLQDRLRMAARRHGTFTTRRVSIKGQVGIMVERVE